LTYSGRYGESEKGRIPQTRKMWRASNTVRSWGVEDEQGNGQKAGFFDSRRESKEGVNDAGVRSGGRARSIFGTLKCTVRGPRTKTKTK